MKKIDINIISNREHCSQIVAGVLMLCDVTDDYFTVIHDKRSEFDYAKRDTMAITLEYMGKKIVYDVDDGYSIDMYELLESCDYYFKRSFSEEKNKQWFSEFDQKKIYPLGLNYHVTYKGNPYDAYNMTWKKRIRKIFGMKGWYSYYTPEKFISNICYKEKDLKIIFFTRIWGEKDELSDEENEERRYINKTRIEILRTLKEKYGTNFIGGLKDTPIAREMAPDLVSPLIYTERSRYLNLILSSDICIGTMGLYESIGWKTAEYVAAAKGIVNEKFHYQLPGDFAEGKNYLSFTNKDECLEAVDYLVSNPGELYKMKIRNQEYYYQYVSPEIMIKRTLDIVENTL